MLPTDLPNCSCGLKSWVPGGVSFSPSLHQQDFQCKGSGCGRRVLFLSAEGGNVLLIPDGKSKTLPPCTIPWLNDVVLPAWRDCAERLKKAREPVEQRWRNYACDEIGMPRDTKNEEIPEAKRQQWREFWHLLQEYPSYKTPAGFEKPLIPPQLPEGIIAYLQTRSAGGNVHWEEVQREVSLAQPVPADPVRVAHDVFFNEVFTELREKLGCNFALGQVENEYCGAKNEPWFTFTLGNNTLVVGPRKRVTTIKVTSPEGMRTESIRAAAQKVDTTYYANDNWRSEDLVAHTLEVHAWNKTQLLDFLNIIGTESMSITTL